MPLMLFLQGLNLPTNVGLTGAQEQFRPDALLASTSDSWVLVIVHSLSSTSVWNVLILTILATHISLLPLWRIYSELQTYVTSFILSKKLIFTASYDVYKHLYSSYLALILLYF